MFFDFSIRLDIKLWVSSFIIWVSSFTWTASNQYAFYNYSSVLSVSLVSLSGIVNTESADCPKASTPSPV